jgi:Tfp pilus assembly protein PilN
VTHQFNLLPARYTERITERRWAGMMAVGLVVVVGLLALDGAYQSRQLHKAAKERDRIQARNAALVTRKGQLAPFRQLAESITARERLLSAAMKTEVSWSGVLASLATSFPSDASLTSINLETQLPVFGTLPMRPGDEQMVIGTTALKGYSVRRFTPGVDRLLQLLGTVNGLSEPRLQVGTREEIGKQPVTTFEGTTFVDGKALTGRYAVGLPLENHVELPSVAAPTPPAPSPATGGGSK